MSLRLLLLLVFLVLAVAATAAAAEAPPARRPSPAEVAAASPVPVWNRAGKLVDQGGRALYVYDRDTAGRSHCDRICAALWPPHYADAGAEPRGPFTLARDADGRAIWAWQGQPLYRWTGDRRRGAAGGDGVAGTWHVVAVPFDLRAQVVAYFPMPLPRTRPAPREERKP